MTAAATVEKARLHEDWRIALEDDLASERMGNLAAFLKSQAASGKTIYPAAEHRLRALQPYGPDGVRVVILGQDPYHGPGQAEGWSFSVPEGVRPPPSLANIYKELAQDVGFHHPGHGHLGAWVQQGVMLLNSVLTVEAGQAASHRGKGWEQFTDRVIATLAARDQPLVFMLWGSYAQKKAGFVDDVSKGGRHLVLRSVHPSPLSAHGGFFGCRHFSQCNAFLESQGQQPIDWQLPALG